MVKCTACGKFMNTLACDIINCAHCTQWFHRECVRVSRTVKNPQDWVCPNCISKVPRSDNSNTPVKNLNSDNTEDRSVSTINIADTQLLEIIRKEIQTTVATEISISIKASLEKHLADIKKELALLQDVKDAVEFMNKEFEMVKDELAVSKKKLNQVLVENDSLKSTVKELVERVNMVEQHARQDNIEITGLPEDKAENLVATALQLGSVVCSTLKESDIVSAVRVRKMDLSSKRPRAIIVKLRNTRVRDEILTSVTKFNKSNKTNKLNSHHFGYADYKTPVFVGEHLSPLNKRIHAETRTVAREKGYKYVWTSDGKVLVRKDDSGPAKHVKNLEAVRLL